MAVKVSVREILKQKKHEIRSRRKKLELSQLEVLLERVPRPLGFEQKIAEADFAFIAEIKRASPSEGEIRRMDAPSMAALLSRSKATCLSFLTDPHFGGSLEELKLAKGLVSKPMLRKDFIIDTYQILESRVYGADAVLLIASCLSRKELQELYALAKQYELDVLLEVHDFEDIEKIPSEAKLIGINNRSLFSENYETDLSVTEKLLRYLPSGKLVISESGVRTREDILRLKALGVHGVLVGTSLMRAKDPKKKVEELLDATN